MCSWAGENREAWCKDRWVGELGVWDSLLDRSLNVPEPLVPQLRRGLGGPDNH